MSETGHIVSTYNLKTVKQKYNGVMKMECPYLSAPNGKICRPMVKQGLDGELDDFDITHYCKGNPNHCYFYRTSSLQKPVIKQLEENKPEEIKVTFFDELSKPKLGEVEISVDQDESHPLLLKSTERGLCYKAKQELVDKLITLLRRK